MKRHKLSAITALILSVSISPHVAADFSDDVTDFSNDAGVWAAHAYDDALDWFTDTNYISLFTGAEHTFSNCFSGSWNDWECWNNLSSPFEVDVFIGDNSVVNSYQYNPAKELIVDSRVQKAQLNIISSEMVVRHALSIQSSVLGDAEVTLDKLSVFANPSLLSFTSTRVVNTGIHGSSKFTHLNGTHATRLLYIGNDKGNNDDAIVAGSALYALSGNSTLDTGITLLSGGDFTHAEGLHNTAKLAINRGSYTMNPNSAAASPSLQAGSLYISKGVFDQYGGVVNISAVETQTPLLNNDIERYGSAHVSGTAQEQGLYRLFDGSLSVSDDFIVGSHGRLSQFGGQSDFNTTRLLGRSSEHELFGGNFNTNGYILNNGEFTQWGGTSTIASLEIANRLTTNIGTFTLNGGTSTINHIGGGKGTATLNVTAGAVLNQGGNFSRLDIFRIGQKNGASFTATHDVETAVLSLGDEAGGRGEYTMTTGELNTDITYVGKRGSGFFEQTGGRHNVADTLYVGYCCEAKGLNGSNQYDLHDGYIFAENIVVGHSRNSASFHQYGGYNKVNGTLTLARYGGVGTYSIAGGSLIADKIEAGTGNAAIYLDGGSINAGTIDIGDNTFAMNGGRLRVNRFVGDLVNKGGIFDARSIYKNPVVEGDYTQLEDASLAIFFGPDEEFGKFTITGDATLDGDLKIEFPYYNALPSYLELGDSFDILAAENIFGELDLPSLISLSSGLMWELTTLVDVLSTTDVLRLSVVSSPSQVPVPASAWLFGSGLLGLIGVARRKKA